MRRASSSRTCRPLSWREHGGENLKIISSTGQQLYRPMGLTDIPGGAAGGGLYAIVLGSGLLMTTQARALRVAVIAGMLPAKSAIYLSQNRVVLVEVIITLLVLLFLLQNQRRLGASAGLTVVFGSIVLGGFA